MHTTLTHRFHYHTKDTLSCMHVFWPTIYQPAFAESAFRGISDIHEYLACIQSSLLAVKQRLPVCKVSHDFVVILSTDLTTFGAISSTSGSTIQV